MINCAKLPRCSNKDREGFTGFATRQLTVDPNRKVSVKWKENASEPRCIFTEKIQSVVTSTFPGSQYHKPQKQVHSCKGVEAQSFWYQLLRVPSKQAQTTWTVMSSGRFFVFFFLRGVVLTWCVLLDVFYCWNDPVEKTVLLIRMGAYALFSWSTELKIFRIFLLCIQSL